MALKDEDIEWTEKSLELQSKKFEPLELSVEQRIEMTMLLKKDWSDNDGIG